MSTSEYIRQEGPSVDDLEPLLTSWFQADRAGVFRQTPLDLEHLARVPLAASVARRRMILRLAVPLSAAAVLAIGVWTWMFYVGLRDLRATRDLQPPFIESRLATAERVHDYLKCAAGPDGVAPPSCIQADLNADGRIDLADFGRFQQTLHVSASPR